MNADQKKYIARSQALLGNARFAKLRFAPGNSREAELRKRAVPKQSLGTREIAVFLICVHLCSSAASSSAAYPEPTQFDPKPSPARHDDDTLAVAYAPAG